MGLFSTKKKKQFYTAAERIIDDSQIMLSSTSATLNYIYSGRTKPGISLKSKSYSDYLQDAYKSCIASKTKTAYRYAERGSYHYGLPTCEDTLDANKPIDTDLKNIIESRLGKTIDLKYGYLSEPNYYHFMWSLLVRDWGYNFNTNKLGFFTSNDCYLKQAILYFSEDTFNSAIDLSYFDQWGLSTEFGETPERSRDTARPHLGYVTNSSITEDYAEVTYQYLEVIPDTTPPDPPAIQSFTGLVVNGVSEKGSTVEVYDGATLLKTSSVDATGHFSITLDSSKTTIGLKAIDAFGNISSTTSVSSGYTNPTTLPDGEEPTQTEFIRESTFVITFGEFFSSNSSDSTTDYTPDKTYVMALYSYIDTTEVYELLTYEYDSGTDTDLDNLISFTQGFGEFFPRLYARLNGIKLNTLDKSTPEYKTSNKLGKILGIKWDEWVDTLHDSVPESGDATHMFIMQAAPINTTDQVILEYLHHFFIETYNRLTTPTISIDGFTCKQGKALKISDNVYSNTISFTGLGFEVVTGTVTGGNTYSSDYIPAVVNVINTPIGTTGNSITTSIKVADAYHSLKKQISPTEYLEIRIFDLSVNHAFGGGGTTVTGLDENMLIPLDFASIPVLTRKEREILFNKCLYLFINVVKIVKVKWYQRGIFKAVLAIASIAITVATLGTGAPVSAYIMAIGVSAITGVAVSFAISLVAKLLIKLGVSVDLVYDLTLLTSLIVLLGGITKSIQMSAKDIMQTVNIALELTTQTSTISLEKIQKEFAVLQAQSEEALKEMDSIRKDLGLDRIPFPIDLLVSRGINEVFIKLGETPDKFFAKTELVLNSGTLAYDVVSSYSDIALTLPTTS